MLLNRAILCAAALLVLSASSAVCDVTFKYVSAGDAKSMATAPRPGVIAESDAFRMSLQMRDKSSHVEMHMTWNEEIVVQEGDVLLNYGDKAADAREISPGEFNGNSIVGERSVMMHP